ncbi:MAG: hypothetical protein IKT52_04400 [Oscillospiraceae bacterium]|nr:hypothetical protein [Oscillospiraceae bacterium]
MAKYYIGIDGGGSKTKFLCFDRDGRECGTAVTIGTYCAQDGIDTVLDRLKEGIAQCLPEETTDVLIGFGMPAYGENRELDTQAAQEIRETFSPMQVYIDNDSTIGWAGSLAMEPGISVVAGTGSIAYGRDASGKTERCGGWHEFFSDEGSGYWLGKQLLQLFSQQSDGRLEKTALYDLVRSELSLQDDFDIIALVNQRYVQSRKDTAALQKILLEAARQGDPHALACYDRASEELSKLILAVLDKLDFPEAVSVSYQGGLFSIPDLIRNPVAQKVSAAASSRKIHFFRPKLDPCRGAVLLAMAELEPENLQTMRINFSQG